ncbi:MAG: hypothetical protein ACUVRR_07150 [Candidatus Fervidibacter sp.]|uniref:hypothetical protein n=1 Tax=Candidatus Fervidibacter sp. TaxID=3100871 RepID=UPI00404B7625
MSLHSRSKAFHHPRLPLRFDFQNEVQCGYFLDRLGLELKVDNERRIRSPKDYVVKIDPLLEEVEQRKNDLVRVECWVDSGITLYPSDLEQALLRLVSSKDKLTFNKF